MASVNKVLIVGGGIAGLGAAIALGQKGIKTTVLELSEQTIGASIAITNRAVYTLRDIGVLQACIDVGFVPPGGGAIFSVMFDGAGNPLPVPPQPTRTEDGVPSLVSIYRPELARILHEAAMAAGADIRIGTSYESLVDNGTGVTATLTDGTVADYDLVIGADGSTSKVRELIYPGISPQYTGWMSFRIMLENGPAGQAGFYMKMTNDMAVTTRLPNDLVYLASGTKMENRKLEQDEALTLLEEELADFSAPFIQAIRERVISDRPHVISRPFSWLMVPDSWCKGRIMVIGDAAHATTAHLSSGGSMALEDGHVLAEELTRDDDFEAGIARFMARRFDRTKFVVETSVELLKMQDSGAHPAAGGMLRAQAVATLSQPY